MLSIDLSKVGSDSKPFSLPKKVQAIGHMFFKPFQSLSKTMDFFPLWVQHFVFLMRTNCWWNYGEQFADSFGLFCWDSLEWMESKTCHPIVNTLFLPLLMVEEAISCSTWSSQGWILQWNILSLEPWRLTPCRPVGPSLREDYICPLEGGRNIPSHFYFRASWIPPVFTIITQTKK